MNINELGDVWLSLNEFLGQIWSIIFFSNNILSFAVGSELGHLCLLWNTCMVQKLIKLIVYPLLGLRKKMTCGFKTPLSPSLMTTPSSCRGSLVLSRLCAFTCFLKSGVLVCVCVNKTLIGLRSAYLFVALTSPLLSTVFQIYLADSGSFVLPALCIPQE